MKEKSQLSEIIAEDYWIKKLSDISPNPFFRRKGIKVPHSRPEQYIELPFPDELYKWVNKAGKDNAANKFMLFAASLSLLLYNYSGEEDILIMTPNISLPGQVLENPVFLRTRIQTQWTVLDLLKEIHKELTEAYDHLRFDLVSFKEKMAANRTDGSELPVQAGMSYSEFTLESHSGPDAELLFGIKTVPDGLLLRIHYDQASFNQPLIARMGNHFFNLLFVICRSREPLLSSVEMLDATEIIKLLDTFNDTQKDFPSCKSVIDLFHEQVAANPDKAALIYNNKTFTYRQLDEQSSRAARYIQSRIPVKRESIIGILLNRSEWRLIAILTVLKLRAAYLPVKVSFPRERISYMVNDCGCSILLTDTPNYSGASIPGVKNIFDIQRITDQEADKSHFSIAGDFAGDLLTVLYTSGTTGHPKGVLLENAGLVDRLYCEKELLGINEDVTTIQTSNYSFDNSLLELFLPFATGGKIVMPQDDDILDFSRLIQLIKRTGVTDLHATPAFSMSLLIELGSQRDDLGPGFKRWCSGGESLTKDIVDLKNRWLPNVALSNHYGPTEATIDSIIQTRINEYKDNIIGNPICNITVRILDRNRQLKPIGVPGELYIGGIGLARGYLNQPELTKEKFIDDPFKRGSRLYKTGDWAKWLPDGSIEYLGRVDDQVKIRGYRIEMAEIERALSKHSAVAAALVVFRKENENYLTAYLVLSAPVNLTQLRVHLQNILPDFMIPAYFVVLDKMPLNANGKIDKSKLPHPREANLNNGESHDLPENDIERSLLEIWKEVLRVDKLGTNTNFFEAGGHSLLATQVVSRIYKKMDIKIDLKAIFTEPTIKELARTIARSEKMIYKGLTPIPAEDTYEVSHAQKRLWIMDQLEEHLTAYNIPVAHVFTGSLDLAAFNRTLTAFIHRHEILRTTFIIENGQPRQKITHSADFAFSLLYIDLSLEKDKEEKARELAFNDTKQYFDLQKGPLLRARLVKLDTDRHLFIFTMHHIVSDGWSENVLVRELVTLYNAFATGKEDPLVPLKIQYKDYASWHNSTLKDERVAKHRDFWLGKFKHGSSSLNLPIDFARPAKRTFNGEGYHSYLDSKVVERLNRLGLERGATLFMILLSGLTALLYRLTAQTDLVIGSAVAGRDHPDLENQIGFYVNTLAFRMRFNDTDNFTQLLDKVKETVIDAFDHQIYPFDKLVDELGLIKDKGHTPLFNVLFLFQTIEPEANRTLKMEGIDVNPYPMQISGSVYDLAFNFILTKESVGMDIRYNVDIFKKETIEAFNRSFHHLIGIVAKDQDVRMQDLDVFSGQENTFPGEEIKSSFNITF
ncbi:MAG TPA: amino acid adenylation domain-containing protein [Puia sp.]|nr:amino acid adenylation domain-containing protein [Puia sp.]